MRARPASTRVDAAVDRVLAAAELEVVELDVPEWPLAFRWGSAILAAEAVASNRALLDDPVRRGQLGAMVAARYRAEAGLTAEDVRAARAFQSEWQRLLAGLLERVELLALPTVAFFPPRLDEATGPRYTELTNPINLAGLRRWPSPPRPPVPCPPASSSSARGAARSSCWSPAPSSRPRPDPACT